MTQSRAIAMACDHAGYDLKEVLKKKLEEWGYTVKDFGTNSCESMDYPDTAHPMGQSIDRGDFSIGISLCGTGNGISMVLNKYPHLRAALCWNPAIAKLAREHNDANVLSLPARFISEQEAVSILKTFLDTPFEGGRHQRRIEKIPMP